MILDTCDSDADTVPGSLPKKNFDKIPPDKFGGGTGPCLLVAPHILLHFKLRGFALETVLIPERDLAEFKPLAHLLPSLLGPGRGSSFKDLRRDTRH